MYELAKNPTLSLPGVNDKRSGRAHEGNQPFNSIN